ncbi:Os08g0548650, partial [Oryza sativa Japonica Group]
YKPGWSGSGAEGDGVIGVVAGEGGGGVVVGVAVGFRARRLEELRVLGRVAGVRVAVGAIAAVLRSAERLAGAAASAAIVGAELGGAALVEVDEAAGVGAVGGGGLDEHGEVVAVDEADVVEVLAVGAVEGELGERGGRGGARAAALHLAGAAVPRGAGALAGVVEFAAGARPEAARPPRRRVEGARPPRREREAGGLQRRRAGARQHPRPHRVRAPVGEGEGDCADADRACARGGRGIESP